MTITITVLLLTGLIHAAGSTFERESDRAATDELSTIGNRLTGEMLAVSRLATTGKKTNVSLTTVYPPRVAGRQYYIDLKSNWVGCTSDKCLVLNTTDDEISVVVPFTSQTAIQEAKVAGGNVVVRYNATTDTMTLEGAR